MDAILSFLAAGAPVAVTHANPLPTYLASIANASTPLGYQQIVGLVGSTALTVPTGSTYAVIATEDQTVRWRDDGVAPTAAVGFPLLISQVLIYDGDLTAIRFIQTAATATLDVTYYG